ncbi:MAG: N-acetylglucosamine-6-phosphate deacetylase [Bacteroidales bacterium]|nr:N-acetylglucosamine-6-phosphate deacetylase [Bacteroidales bacterium]
MKQIEGILYSDNSPISLEIEKGIIRKVKKTERPQGKTDLPYIAPALIDNQVNGNVGIEFSRPDLSMEDMLKTVREHRKNGVTTFVPTVITASHESLVRSFGNLAATLGNPEVARAIPGFHLEGPYISPEDGYRGAHSRKYVRKPDWDEFQRLNEAAEGKIIQVTLAPEVEGALRFIKKCVQQDIVVALGHHNGSAEDIERAVDAGARTVTHLGNGMANSIHRFNNPLWMQLAEDRLMCSLILDGFHLPQEMVKVFYRTKGTERIMLTSDMTMLAGMPPGNYVWDGKEVRLTGEGMILYEKENCFAGASLPVSVGIGNMMKFTGCGLGEAVDMATKNPAKLYGLDDRGSIVAGKRADLILFDIKNGKLNIAETMAAK